MSIIHDALKKVQSTTTSTDLGITQKPSSTIKKRAKNRQNILIATTIITMGTLIALTYFFIVSMPKTSLQQIPYINHIIHKNKSDKNRIHKITSSHTKSHKYNDKTIFLNGTVIIEGKRAALINNEIYKIGDTINGKKIVNITLEKIDLLDGDKIITIKQKR